MGHDKLRKFAENETFSCLLQPDSREIISHGEKGELLLNDHPIKGHWGAEMFGNDHPIIVELGCGKGEYTIALAERHPENNYIGVDIKGARLWKGAKYATLNSLPNVAFLRTRIEFLPALFATDEVSQIWLTFSDPQMKSENSRLTSPLFLERYRSIMVPGGIVHLKTDSRFLHEYSMAVVSANSLRLLASTKDLYATSPEELMNLGKTAGGCGSDEAGHPASALRDIEALYQVQTFYESMFLKMGIPITYMAFVIDHDGPFVYPEFDATYWRAAEGPRRSFSHNPAKEK